MFNQQEYINDFIKTNYKSVKLRVRNDDKIITKRLEEVDNVNQYLIDLIMKDICEHHDYRYINNDVKIDFPLSRTMKYLVDEAERADLLDDYGLYMNIADAIDSQGKKETTHHVIRESDWKKLTRRYRVW